MLVLEPLAGGLPHVLGMVFEDTVRPESAAAVAQLQGRGAGALRPAVDVLMLTGDVQASALAAALAVGIEGGKVQAGMTPDAKLRAVDDIRGKDAEACIVMMGDGINDAPALAAADVGVAVAATAEAAVAAAADVICVRRVGLLTRVCREIRGGCYVSQQSVPPSVASAHCAALRCELQVSSPAVATPWPGCPSCCAWRGATERS